MTTIAEPFNPEFSPGMTDLMVDPETILDYPDPTPAERARRGKKRAGRTTGVGAYRQALTNARFGHTRWLVWDRDGVAVADRCTIENLKECLLDEGTTGRWIIIHGDGVGMVGTWRIGINVLAQMKRGL